LRSLFNALLDIVGGAAKHGTDGLEAGALAGLAEGLDGLAQAAFMIPVRLVEGVEDILESIGHAGQFVAHSGEERRGLVAVIAEQGAQRSAALPEFFRGALCQAIRQGFQIFAVRLGNRVFELDRVLRHALDGGGIALERQQP